MPERAVYYQEVAIVCGFGREYNLKAAFGSKDSIRWDVGTEALIQPILELAPRLRCMVESGESVEVAVNEYAAVALARDAELHESEINSDHSFTATRLVFADLVGRELDGQRIERLLQSCLQSSRSSQPPPVKLGTPADGDEPWEQMLIEVAIFADDLKRKDERFRARGGQGYLFV